MINEQFKDRIEFEIELIEKYKLGTSQWDQMYSTGYIDGLKRAIELSDLNN